jgi:hypothetical protein
MRESMKNYLQPVEVRELPQLRWNGTGQLSTIEVSKRMKKMVMMMMRMMMINRD